MLRLLLIDDDNDDAEVFKEALEEVDPSILIEHFDDPQEALRLLMQRTAGLPHIIFLDINMPVISGWVCLNELKKTEHLKAIPVIIYTTSSEAREKQISHDLGASGFITKPDDYFKLKDSLAAAIATARTEHL